MPTSDNKTKKMPVPKTTKLPRGSSAAAASGGQAPLKRTRKSAGTADFTRAAASGGAHSKKNNPSKKGTGKKVALALLIVVLAVALGLSLAWNFGLFGERDTPQTQDTTQPEPSSTAVDESSAEAGDTSSSGTSGMTTYTRYATGSLSLEYPSAWSVMTYEGAQTIVATRGTIADGYIKLGNAQVSDYGAGAVTGVSSMKAFVERVAAAQKLDIDIDKIAIIQRGNVWTASLPLSLTKNGTSFSGEELLAATGNTAHLIQALCPASSKQAQWPLYQHVLDSLSFDAGSDLPDEGRD